MPGRLLPGTWWFIAYLRLQSGNFRRKWDCRGGNPDCCRGSVGVFHSETQPQVALAFFGDGATNEGAFHEAANEAGVWKLPVIFFCENNLYGEGTPQSKQAAVPDLAVRASSYGFPGVIVDGNDVLAVYEATCLATERARKGDGPTFIEAKTYRQRGHYEGDPQIYRSVEEMEAWKKKDPIPAFRNRLIKAGVFNDADLEEIEGSVITQLNEAVSFAANASKPEPKDALAGVYADTHNGLVF